jgi:hypothetical protein
MIAMELSGVHLNRKALITWRGKKSDKPYKKQGTIFYIGHSKQGGTVKLEFKESKRNDGWGYDYYTQVSIPYYAEVTFP